MTAPSDPRVEILSLEVPCDRHAPAIVREELGELEGIGRSLGDGVLVASELVSNAVLHSGCDTDHVLEVRASLSGNRLLISVRDPGLSGRSAEPRRADTVEPGGWGLHIVARPAQRWGAERPSGYRAWAELAVGPRLYARPGSALQLVDLGRLPCCSAVQGAMT